MILVFLFAAAFVLLVPSRDENSNLKSCLAKIHRVDFTDANEIATCLSSFKNEEFEKLLLIELKKNQSPKRMLYWLNELWPLLNEGEQQSLSIAIHDFIDFEAESGVSIYHEELKIWFLNLNAEQSKEFKQCYEREPESCYEALSNYDDEDVISNKQWLEFALYSTSSLGRWGEFHKFYDNLGDDHKARWLPVYKKAKKNLNDETLEKSLSQNFELYQEKGVVSLSADHYLVLEKALAFITKEYSWYPKLRIPVVMYESKSYSGLDEDLEWVEALYDGKIRIPIEALESARLYDIALHEIIHVMIDKRIGPTPTWFNEGFAQWVESSKTFTPPQKMLSVEELENQFVDNLDVDKIPSAYRWSLFLFEKLIKENTKSNLWNFMQEDEGGFEERFVENFNQSSRSFVEETIQSYSLEYSSE